MLTRDDVIRTARECRAIVTRTRKGGDGYLALFDRDDLERFAAAVAAAEREACAQLCDGEPRTGRQGAARNGPDGAGAWYDGSPMHRVTSAIAAAIRQRGAA